MTAIGNKLLNAGEVHDKTALAGGMGRSSLAGQLAPVSLGSLAVLGRQHWLMQGFALAFELSSGDA